MTKLNNDPMISLSALDWWSSWSDRLGVAGISLGLLVAAIAVVGWCFSWKSSKLKDEALAHFKQESNAEIAKANRTAAVANENAANLRNRAAQAELELAKIQDKLSPRLIKSADYKKTARSLSGYQNTPISIVLPAGSGKEQIDLAMNIQSFFVEVGYNVQRPSEPYKQNFSDGISIQYTNKNDPAFIKTIIDTFSETGLVMTSTLIPDDVPAIQDFSSNEIRIIVGPKP